MCGLNLITNFAGIDVIGVAAVRHVHQVVQDRPALVRRQREGVGATVCESSALFLEPIMHPVTRKTAQVVVLFARRGGE